MARAREKHRGVEEVTLTIEGVLNGHRHLFNKLCEERRVTEGKTPAEVLAWMLWVEADRVFGHDKAQQIYNDYWWSNDP